MFTPGCGRYAIRCRRKQPGTSLRPAHPGRNMQAAGFQRPISARMEASIYRLRDRDILAVCVLALLVMGVVMVQSASATLSGRGVIHLVDGRAIEGDLKATG